MAARALRRPRLAQIGIVSAVLCCFAAPVLALAAGFFGGWLDSVLSRVMDRSAFPVYLLSISLATVPLTHGRGEAGIHHHQPSSLWRRRSSRSSTSHVFRPVRGQRSGAEKEYVGVDSQGASSNDVLRDPSERDPTVIVLLRR